MPEALASFDVTKALLFIAPGALFAIFRSFALRGFFPSLSKDDVGALAISSSVFVLFVRLMGTDVTAVGIWDRRSTVYWFVVLILFPMCCGLVSGLIEANDLVGRGLRHLGFRFPSPEPNAWETMFREMPADALLMVRLSELWVYGRWVAGSASSQLTDSRDLFLSEIGELSESGAYTPYLPPRGIYLSAGEIKRIEVVKNPVPDQEQSDHGKQS